MTTFVAATFKYVSSGFALHSFSEPVYFTSLSFFGLISLFHFIFSYIGLNFTYLLFYKYLPVLSIVLTVLNVYADGQNEIYKVFFSRRR